MNNNRPLPLWRRILAAFVLVQLALGPLATPAYAQLTKLADEPIAFTPSAPPNIMLTVDDSTSMLSDFLPDYVIGAFCRDASGGLSTVTPMSSNPSACGFVGSPTSPQYIWSAGATLGGLAIPYPRYADGSPPNATNYSNSSITSWLSAWPAPVHSNALNRLYYDPAVTYSPPLKYDGTPYPNYGSPWTAVHADPWATELRTENLTTSVRIGMWCNSDHPDTTDWNPGTGGGAECRINGTNYSAVAPAAPADYQYPWRNTAGNDIRNFTWGASGTGGTWNKRIYCNMGHFKYPRNLPCTVTGYTCPAPQTYIPLTPLPQTCFFQGDQTSCVGPVTYSPAGCNTNPLYGLPGPCVGPECLTCTTIPCPTGVTGKLGRCRLASTAPPGSGGSNAACNCSGIGCSLPACPNYNPPGMGTCSGGAVPTPVTNCTPNNNNDCGLRLYNPVTGLNDGPTLIADANGAGEVCRRNNRSYPDGTIASPYNYPAAPFSTLRNNATCGTVPGFATVPRHYWKSSVEWCSAQITTANHKWRTFGSPGTCQDERTVTHQYPRFYKYGVPKTDPAYLDNVTFPAFERVDLTPTIPNYTHTYWRNGAYETITRTYAQEMTNYANWFAYYRTRIQAAKTVISQNFTYLDTDFRVGFHTLSNNPPTSFVDVAAFDALAGGQKDKWYQQLFGIQITMGKQTPNMDAVVRIGELFKNGNEPSLLGSSDPITLSCQKNYHMLFTDGITNQGALPTVTVGNVDNTVPALPEPLVVLPPIVAGSPWPNLFREDPLNSLANTLADYTTHYWVTDMRPGMTNNVLIGKDPAPWQHLNFAALSLGTEGTLPSAGATTEAQIAAGTLKWPKPTPSQYAPGPTGVDDLWHAAVNGRGRFVNAKTSQQLGRGIAQILSDITSPAGGLTGAVFSNPNLSATNRHTYLAKFTQGWGGNVQKIEIDPQTAAPITVVWDAEAALIGQTTPAAPPNDKPWYTNRRIVTIDEGGSKVAFLRANLGATQRSTLGPDAAYQDRVIEYLRGDRSLEGEDDGQFRVRPSPLGDIVNSQPVIVGDPEWSYLEANDPGYAAFKTAMTGRSKRVYVGSNDGMLHAFDDSNGTEAWAFVPRDFYRKAPPVSFDKSGLIGLTYQPGGLPLYAHRFYVDATPRVVDANLAGTWKTLLVGGLGKGGQSYYALDVTNPAAVTDEATAASKVLWEFRNADLGYTYGKPTIIKTRAFGGKWLAVVSSGYNNATGEGKLFFLDAATGALLKTMGTGTGSPANPSGLAHFNAYVQDYRNQLAEQFYAGDLLGNVWRFNVQDPNDANWTVQKLAKLTDSFGADQPITIPPMIEVDITNGVDRWVFVGTGRLLHEDDLSDTQPQRMYALRDGTYDTPGSAGLPLTPADLDVVSGVAGLGSGVIAAKGWYDDLAPGQRIVRPVAAAVGLIAYIATGLPIDPCEVGQPAHVFVRQFGNGESRLESGPGVFTESIYVPDGGAGLSIISTEDPSCTDNCIPQLKLAVTTTKPEIRLFGAQLPGFVNQNRISWRQLGQ